MRLATTELMNGHPHLGDRSRADVVIPSDPAEARRIQVELERLLESTHFNERDLFGIRLAVEEALINAIKHGNQMDATKKVHVSYLVTPDRLELRVTDEGPGFDPQDVPDPTDVENVERPCGRGLLLMRHYMTEVHYNARGNSVHMKKIARK